MSLQQIAAQRCFGGWQKRFSHPSTALKCSMQFSVYLPPQAEFHSVPALYWLSGLTCSDEILRQNQARSGSQQSLASH